MTDLERQILEHVRAHDTRKRDLIRRFQSVEFPAAYRRMIDAGLIYEEGSGRNGDPKNVRPGQPPVACQCANLLPFVTLVPRTAWVDFLSRCVIAGQEPEQVVLRLLAQAIVMPTKAQYVDRGY